MTRAGLAFYNEIDPVAAAVLREFIARDLIAPGHVDTRSIKEISADDVRDFTQCHWFAGAGLWSVAARLARWPDDRPIWTASCPCQPYSVAGGGAGDDDPRNLWPDLFRILRGARALGFGPAVVMGEQVSGSDGYGWFDGVRANLASEGYASRTLDFPSCAVDSPQQRNRLGWVAVASAEGGERGTGLCEGRAERDGHIAADGNGRGHLLGGTERSGLERQRGHGDRGRKSGRRSDRAAGDGEEPLAHRPTPASDDRARPNGSWWADAEWLLCHDQKTRRAKPGTPMLVNGMVGRVDLWRLCGNSINPVVYAEMIAAFMDVTAGEAKQHGRA